MRRVEWPPPSRAAGPLVVAHRGASGSYPENTAAAFVAAGRSGARTWECDVRLTHDGVPVVIHDAYLDRTTDGKGAVRDATLGEVMGLSAGYASRFGDRFAAQRVPTLEEVLRLARGEARLLIELKVDGGDSERAEQLVGAVIDHVEAAGALREVALISFDPAALAAARRAAPGVEIGLLAARGAGPVDPVDAAAAAGARMLILAKDLLSEGVAAEAEHARLLLATYSVETAEELAALGAFGLYAVATDWPERLALARGVRLD